MKTSTSDAQQLIPLNHFSSSYSKEKPAAGFNSCDLARKKLLPQSPAKKKGKVQQVIQRGSSLSQKKLMKAGGGGQSASRDVGRSAPRPLLTGAAVILESAAGAAGRS